MKQSAKRNGSGLKILPRVTLSEKGILLEIYNKDEGSRKVVSGVSSEIFLKPFMKNNSFSGKPIRTNATQFGTRRSPM